MKKMKIELLFGLLSLILGLQVKAHSESQTFNDGRVLPKKDNIAWMLNLNDDLPISKITLPGTHDTMALHGGPAVECQAWTLENQLNAGIRYLDLRAYRLFNKILLVHGPIYQKSNFSKALDTIKAFLSRYSSETVLVRVKPEKANVLSVQKEVQHEIDNDPDRFWVKPEIPTLREVRGKVVFVQKRSFGLGISLKETDAKGDYKVTNIDLKKQLIEEKLKQAKNQCESPFLFYSSGTGIGTLKPKLTPKEIAKEINPWLNNLLPELYSTGSSVCFGIIAMDFPGFDLIQKIIQFNNVRHRSSITVRDMRQRHANIS